MEEIQKQDVDPKEVQQEEVLLKEAPQEELRKSVVEDYGLDEDTNSELIDKLVAERTESSKALSTAIKQKRGWRKKALTPKEEKKPEVVPVSVMPKPEEIERLIEDKFGEKEMNAQNLGEELKKEIKTYAKASGLTVTQALNSDYFKYLKGVEEAKQKVEEAAIGGKRRVSSRQEFDVETPPKPDMSTVEGRKEWADYKVFLKSQK